MDIPMKLVYFIFDKNNPHKHVLIGINKKDIGNARVQTPDRQEINWNTVIWEVLCSEETHEYVKRHLVHGGFDPYENTDTADIYLKEMLDMHFYKEIIML